MELQFILDSIKDNKAKVLIEKIKAKKTKIDTDAVALYDIANHDVMLDQLGKRPKKSVTRTLRNAEGEALLDDQGNKKTVTERQEVTRIPLPMQKYIVEQRMNMLLANPVELDAATVSVQDENLIDVIQKTWQNNKIDYELKQLFLRQMSETEVAAILYLEDAEEGYWEGTPNKGKKQKIRMNIIESNGGKTLFPIYNLYNDMVAFGYAYKVIDDATDKEIEHFDLYTAEKNYFWKAAAGGWEEDRTPTENIDKKIPVVYFPQSHVEWHDVQPAITRKETLLSNHGDTNNYSGSPIAVFTAESIESLPEKDESGKAIQLTGKDADVKYLEATNSSDSLKMEYEKLDEGIYMFSGTINYNALQGFFGSAPSGYAIKLLFQNAHLKAAQKEADFGKGVQRLINLMKSMLCAINPALNSSKNLNVKPVFTYFLPKNITEDLDILIKAKEAGGLSQETFLEKSPIVEDGGAELERIKQEQENEPVPPAPVPPTPPTA